MVNEYGAYSMPKAFKDREIYKVLAAGEVYEPRTIKMMQTFARGGDIVSGGAFVGDFLPALSRSLKGSALLHSFDPNPMAYTSACHTVALNGLENVCLHNVAVGDVDAVLPLQISRRNGEVMGGRARVIQKRHKRHTIDVNVVTLDALIPGDRMISVLHLDIEGHEAAAVLGAKDLIRRCKPLLVLEAATKFKQRKISRLLRREFSTLNYRQVAAFERNAVFLAQG